MQLATTLLALVVQSAPAFFEQQVEQALQRGADFLLAKALPHGAWEGDARPGHSALALYAVWKSGRGMEEVALWDALAELYSMNPARQTYDTALVILALCAHDARLHFERIEDLAAALLDWQEGGWGYPTGYDLSNTQYAALGLWAAARAGVQVPRTAWQELFEALGQYRCKDGGFSYRGSAEATGSMTAAGLGTLAICLEGLGASADSGSKSKGRGQVWIEEAQSWLAKHFSVTENPGGGGWLYYYLYGLERAGALSGATTFGSHDWYREGAEHLLAHQLASGGWSEFGESGDVVTTAFAVLFLKRATRPSSPTQAAAAPRRFGILDAQAAVRVLATGQRTVTLWIDGYSDEMLGKLEWPNERGLGPRVERVNYYAGRALLQSLTADPNQPSQGRRFEIQHEFQEYGEHQICVELIVLEPVLDQEGRVQPRRNTLRSAYFPLAIEAPPTERAQAWLGDWLKNRLPESSFTASASSTWRLPSPAPWRTVDARQACDGRFGTPWLADPSDRRPRLDIHLEEPLLTQRILITPALSRPFRPGGCGRILELELTLNRTQVHRLRMPYDELRKGILELPQALQLKQISLQILWSVPGEDIPAVGVAELELQGEPD